MDKLNKTEKDFVRDVLAPMYGIEWPCDISNVSDDLWECLRDAAMDFEVVHGLDENYRPNAKCLIALSIIDKLE